LSRNKRAKLPPHREAIAVIRRKRGDRVEREEFFQKNKFAKKEKNPTLRAVFYA
jgi:hypothetical protein